MFKRNNKDNKPTVEDILAIYYFKRVYDRNNGFLDNKFLEVITVTIEISVKWDTTLTMYRPCETNMTRSRLSWTVYWICICPAA